MRLIKRECEKTTHTVGGQGESVQFAASDAQHLHAKRRKQRHRQRLQRLTECRAHPCNQTYLSYEPPLTVGQTGRLKTYISDLLGILSTTENDLCYQDTIRIISHDLRDFVDNHSSGWLEVCPHLHVCFGIPLLIYMTTSEMQEHENLLDRLLATPSKFDLVQLHHISSNYLLVCSSSQKQILFLAKAHNGQHKILLCRSKPENLIIKEINVYLTMK